MDVDMLTHSGLERGSRKNSFRIQTTDKLGDLVEHLVSDSLADYPGRSSPGCGSLARAKTMVAIGATYPLALSFAINPECRTDDPVTKKKI